MYTNLGGIEFTRKDKVAVTLGGFLGAADREDVSGNFRGVELGLSAPIGLVNTSVACLFGKIDDGSYRKCGIEGGIDFREESSLPITLTFSIEERYFDFGNGGPVSDPRDAYIFITGVEIHLEKLHLSPEG